jgi:uncharacterized protein YodC (DUF2158 family)
MILMKLCWLGVRHSPFSFADLAMNGKSADGVVQCNWFLGGEGGQLAVMKKCLAGH